MSLSDMRGIYGRRLPMRRLLRNKFADRPRTLRLTLDGVFVRYVIDQTVSVSVSRALTFQPLRLPRAPYLIHGQPLGAKRQFEQVLVNLSHSRPGFRCKAPSN
jgi:hypothetical protein